MGASISFCQLGLKSLKHSVNRRTVVATVDPHNLIETSESMILSCPAVAECQVDRYCCWQHKCFALQMDAITDIPQSQLQKDVGSDVTGYDVSVTVTDTKPKWRFQNDS
jgi:hypothetical protein